MSLKLRVPVSALLLAVMLVPGLPAPEASAAPALPAGFILRDQPSGQAAFDLTDFAYLPDDSILSLGKGGKIAWVSPTGQARLVATLPVVGVGDLGLVGLAVAPDYATSHRIYLARSVPQPGAAGTVRAASWTVTVDGDGVPTGLSGEKTLVEMPQDAVAHGMTGIIAAPDGTLWVSVGDLADFTKMDPTALRALDPDAPQGKILHLTGDGKGVPGNPYYDAANPGSTRSKVFARGFRSPFRFSLDASTGLPVVGDVGWNTWEELDVVQPGANQAWPCWEGKHQTPGYSALPGCAGVVNTPPAWEYHHGDGLDQGNSITGGFVYAGTSYPAAYRGAYFFGDYVTQKVWTARYDAQGNLMQNPASPAPFTAIGGPVRFAPAANGDVVFADIYSGNLRRLSYVQGNKTPVASATSNTDPDTRTVSFDGSGSFDYDNDQLTYAWNFGDGTTGDGVRAAHTYGTGTDRFTAKLTVTDPLGASASVDVAVAPGNHTPQLTVADGKTGMYMYTVNELISLTASTTDVEDGTLPVTWTTLVRHCPQTATCHAHPGIGGSGAAFGMPFTDHPDSRSELTASVTDTDGVTASVTYVALPREHRLTLASNVPAALNIPAEGGVGSAMVAEGATFDVDAPALAADGVSTFTGWTGGPATTSWTITVGTADQTLTANYATPIDQRYNADAPLRDLLGAPSGPEITDGTVHYRGYAGGRLYWSATTGVRRLSGPLLDKYLAMGGHQKYGPPATDVSVTPDGAGRYVHLPAAPGIPETSIYWTQATGAHLVTGRIRVRWEALGWEKGPMGYPLTDELSTPDGVGRFNHFSKGGSIYWTNATDSHGVWGAIRQKWADTGWERGPAGYPLTDESVTPNGVGRYNHFSKAASIYWTNGTGAHLVYGSILQRWAGLGWERSYLGFPTTDEFGITIGRQSSFQSGYITWNGATGQVIDRRY
ncbi:PQQ-dependent sugar dehydrogenase [Amycolatopsis sp. H20-H5]|uniref:PQQ-dependent sugar dehydrogenase n=1 Tax=Amycolatopsis sp. H20-H5 TaxID=3046309 RepID=UPI002DBA2169|nr:PQQ-dependent sugar dehydrogenase [Amycolatopsis sp. H20-H5]MEC3975163.1 PQQ-dependent sugar dehydrogenase [Amycolatopsis sp. H20-H5]